MLGPCGHGWGMCMEWGLAGRPSTTGSCAMVTMPKDPKESPYSRPAIAVSAWCRHRGGRTDNGSWTMAHWQHAIFGDEHRFQLHPVDGRLRGHCLHGERFQQRYQADRIQTSGGSVYVWETFHSGAKSPFVLPNRYHTGALFCETP